MVKVVKNSYILGTFIGSGRTGSGKTHTLMGSKKYKNGLIYNTILRLIQQQKKYKNMVIKLTYF